MNITPDRKSLPSNRFNDASPAPDYAYSYSVNWARKRA
jgi:hypothetical protein